jgi:hypothetical protein
MRSLLEVLAALGGLVALLPYISAVKHDRRMKFAQMLLERLHEIPKAVAAYIQASNRADTRETLLRELRSRIAKESNENAKKFWCEQEQKYLVDLYDAQSECKNTASRTVLLIAMCPYADKFNKDLADSLIKSMHEDKPNLSATMECAAKYIQAEAQSILRNLNGFVARFCARVQSILKPPAVSGEVSGKAAGQAGRPESAPMRLSSSG